jgi:hypothetical protein
MTLAVQNVDENLQVPFASMAVSEVLIAGLRPPAAVAGA